MLEGAAGDIGAPPAGAVVDGPATVVAGWVIFPGADVDHIEVFCDGESMGPAAWGNARPDVQDAIPEAGIDALTSGFQTVIPLRVENYPRECIVQVRATASDRSVWTSAEHTFTVGAGPRDGELELMPKPFVTAAARDRRGEARRRRWCVFTHALSLGGGELYLQELLLRLQATGTVDILVVAPGTGPLQAELERAGITVQITPGYWIHPDYYGGRQTELTALLRAWDAEVVLINTLGLFPCADAATGLGLPVLWAIHESFSLQVFELLAWGPSALTPGIRARWHEAMRHSELIYEADSTMHLHEADLPGLSARKIRYGINLDEIARYRRTHDRSAMRAALGFAAEDRVLLCMGVIQDRKGQIPLLRAFSRCVADHPHARLVFVGDHDAHPYPRALRECVTALGLEDRVDVIKIQPDTYRWYFAADVLVSAADVESLPRSILEAQAFGLPVLAADVFGIREVVTEGSTGWLFESRRGQAMITAVGRVLATSSEDLARFSREALAASAGYDGAGYAQAYAQLAEELCRRRDDALHNTDAMEVGA